MKTLSFLPEKLLACLIATVIMLSFSGCNRKENIGGDSATIDYATAPTREEATQRKADISQAPPIHSQPQFEQKIIRNASLRFQVDDYPKSINAIQNLVKSHKGFVVS